MKKLYLMRHGKSSWDDLTLDDHDRPLSSRGRKGSALVAQYIRDKGHAPAIVLCSSATRACETLDRLRPALPDSTKIKVEPRLYGANSRDLLKRLRRLSQTSPAVLVIGHNPAMQELVLELVGYGGRTDAVQEKFPTGALAVLELSIDEWRLLQPGEAKLVDLVTPKRLRK